MKKKDYLEPTVQVVKLQQQTALLQASGEISATMNGTFTEENLAPEFTMEDDFSFQEESFSFQGE